ncbi:MAG: ATP-dependent zinc metalloprotease FtsH [Symbiobacteriaceae bacterium]|nr:ATP-dependent zinc metalloprotease FtsH [Symbiobacteriaceae bacterium]
MSRNYRNLSFYLLIILIAMALISYLFSDQSEPQAISYGELYDLLLNEQVEEIVITGNEASGKLTNGESFTSTVPWTNSDALQELLLKVPSYKVANPADSTWWLNILNYVLIFALMAGVWFFFTQQSNAGGGNRVMNFGRSRARLYKDDKHRITYADVAGYEEVKEELQEIVEFLKTPAKFIEIGAHIPKGVLLYGPPGTGKTLVARATAGEAGVPFFSISGSDFVEMFVGVGASRVRDLFENAKKNVPCIVFIDEIDAVGRQRGTGLGGGHDEREQTLNQLLVEMDGFEVNESIIVIAATNRPDILDPALLRPGRFDRQVGIDRPDIKEREAILNLYARNKPMEEGINILDLARATPGFTPADLENLVNEAALLAARRDKKKVSREELEEAITRVMAGPAKKSRVMSEKERWVSAVHEAGHAVVGCHLKQFDPVHTVTIIPRGQAGGFTTVLPVEDRYHMTRLDLTNMITFALGGRVAESILLEDISTGATNDLERVSQMARRMVTEFGMSERLGPMTFGAKQHEVFLGRDISRNRDYSEEVANVIDEEIRLIVEKCLAQATEILQQHRRELHHLSKTLLERETVTGEELPEIFEAALLNS